MLHGEKQGILTKKVEGHAPFLKNMRLFPQISKKRTAFKEGSPFVRFRGGRNFAPI
jgi:hypothetical protein